MQPTFFSASFKDLQARDRQASITCTAGDDHAAGLHVVAVGPTQDKTVAGRAFHREHSGRNHDLSPKSLSLAGNVGRKAEVIFTTAAGGKHTPDKPSEAAYTAVASPELVN